MGRIGNLYEQSVAEIWNGVERARFVSLVSDGEFCSKYCPECRHTKYNLVIHQLLEQRQTAAFL